MTWGPRRPPFGPIRIPAGLDIIGMFQRLADQGIIRQDQVPREDPHPTKMIHNKIVKVEPMKRPSGAIFHMKFEYKSVGEERE